VRRWLEVSGAGPEGALAALEELWDPDADYYPVRKFPEAKPCHSREEFSRFIVQWLAAFSVLDNEVRELVPVGDDRVLACSNLVAEGRASGMRLEGDLYQCFWLRHGRIFRVEDHLTLSRALHALGLDGETLEGAGLRDRS